MNTEEIDPVRAQPSDPAWARLLFAILEGRDGQCWRAVLLMMPFLLLVTGLVVVTTQIQLVSWIGGALVVGSLTAGALALSRRRKQLPPR